jgi:uncharacterized protein YbaR (Trm112 family)
MLDPELLTNLRCPETRQELRAVDTALLDQLNQQIAAGALRNCGGRTVNEKLDGGLVRTDGKVLYPIRRNIPVMLTDEAITLSGTADSLSAPAATGPTGSRQG